MAKKIYNQQKVETTQASLGSRSDSPAFRYKGFNSRNRSSHFKQYDMDLVKQDLLNHFHIRKGEKLQLPEFGTSVWDLLFEPMNDDNLERMRADVEEIINRDPRINANSIVLDTTEHGVRIEIDLDYAVLDASEQLVLNFDRRTINR